MAHTNNNGRYRILKHTVDNTKTENKETTILSMIEETKNTTKDYESLTTNCTSKNDIYKENDISLEKYNRTQDIVKAKCQGYLKQFNRNRQLMKKEIKDKFKKIKISKSKKRSNKEKMIIENNEDKYDKQKEETTDVIEKEKIEEIIEKEHLESMKEKIKEEKENDDKKEWDTDEKKEEATDEKKEEVTDEKKEEVTDEKKENDTDEKKKEYVEQKIIEGTLRQEIDSEHEKNNIIENEQSNEMEREQESVKSNDQTTLPGKNRDDNTFQMQNHTNKLHDYTKSEFIRFDAIKVNFMSETADSNRDIKNVLERKTNSKSVIEQKKEIDNEKLRYIFSILKIGIQKIETIKELYKDYKENFNKSMREKIEKINSFMFYSNCNNFHNNFTDEYLQNKYKLNNMKEERIGRLFLYIEDINKIKQALKMKQKEKGDIDGTDNNSEKNESFYDAIENIDDFFIFDDTISWCVNSEEIESVMGNSEYKTVSLLQEDDRFDDFLGELKKDQSERRENDNKSVDKERSNDNINEGEYKDKNMEEEKKVEEENKNNNGNSAFNRFPKFSFKNYYCFDLNKNLCYIYSFTPTIFKKLGEMLHSYNAVKNDDNPDDSKLVNESDKTNMSFDVNCSRKKDNFYYQRYAVDGGHNFETYIQFHCEKWQENLYDHVEVNSIDVEFNLDCLKCKLMQLF